MSTAARTPTPASSAAAASSASRRSNHETKAKLRAVLVKKLTGVYGDGDGARSAVNATIEKEVAGFMERCKGKVGEADLRALEQKVRQLPGAKSRGKPRGTSSRVSTTSRASTQKRGPGSVAHDAPASLKDDWLIMETYSQVQADRKENAEQQAIRQRAVDCKRALADQIRIKEERRKREKEQEERYAEQQRRMQKLHAAEQEKLKAVALKKVEEERVVRQFQIRDNQRRRDEEARQQR